jgi:hypothetical protein
MSEMHHAASEPGIGDKVVLLVHTDDLPIWTTGAITSISPFSVEFDPSHASHFAHLQSVLILRNGERRHYKAAGKITDLTTKGEHAWITLEDFNWESVDNRDNPRLAIEARTIVRSVSEIEDQVQTEDQLAVTRNLSMGGASLRLSRPIDCGQIVDLRIFLEPGVVARAMGIVVHTNLEDPQIGVSFLEFVGGARYSLHRHLANIAA